MGLRIRYQGGPFAGRTLEFGEDTERVVFGRDAARCDVVLPEDATQVGREHCAVHRVLGSWRVELSGRHTLLVDGAQVHDEQPLESMSELKLGPDGPVLWLEHTGGSELRATEGVGRQRTGTHTRVQRLQGRLHGTRRALWVGGLVVLLLAVAGAFQFAGLSSTLARDRFEIERLGTQRHDRLVEALESYRSELPSPADFGAVAGRAEASVLLVLHVSAAGIESEVGTAWVVDDARLATNAHVAEAFESISAGERLVARTPGASPRDFDIVGIELHPGYRSFEELTRRIAARDPLTGASEVFLAACDVALMSIDPASVAELPPALPLAPRSELEGLRGGERVAFVGYPAEGLPGGGTDLSRPQPTTQIGHVTSVTDVFQRSIGGPLEDRVELREGHVVRHDLPTIGGASGSPMLDVRGRVVALISASSFHFLESTDSSGVAHIARIPIGGFSFAQRADLAQELLDGDADERQARRDELWRLELERRVARSEKVLLAGLAEDFARQLEAEGLVLSGAPEFIVQERGQLDEAGLKRGESYALGAVEAGHYLICALAASDEPLELIVRIGKDFYPARVRGPLVALRLELAAGQQPEVLVGLSRSGRVPEPVGFGLHVLRAQTR